MAKFSSLEDISYLEFIFFPGGMFFFGNFKPSTYPMDAAFATLPYAYHSPSLGAISKIPIKDASMRVF